MTHSEQPLTIQQDKLFIVLVNVDKCGFLFESNQILIKIYNCT